MELTNLNVMIGGNGSGKSNLISFFSMLHALINGNLNHYVEKEGGAGDLLFNGRKVTDKIEFEAQFGSRGYRFALVPTSKDTFEIEDEARYDKDSASKWWETGDSADGFSSIVQEVNEDRPDAVYSRPVYDAIASWQRYHFHDTSASAGMRHYEIIQDNKVLRADAANIAPFLLRIKKEHPHEYQKIINAVRLVIPFLDDFLLETVKHGAKEEVNISWTQQGSDYPMQPYHFSGGSLRFICLVTALLQPKLPAMIMIDEPELGLHPGAMAILAELIELAAQQAQVVVATQSPTLINEFAIADIIVANRKDGASTFNRLQEKDFSGWLEHYLIGELWTKNVIDGGPVYE